MKRLLFWGAIVTGALLIRQYSLGTSVTNNIEPEMGEKPLIVDEQAVSDQETTFELAESTNKNGIMTANNTFQELVLESISNPLLTVPSLPSTTYTIPARTKNTTWSSVVTEKSVSPAVVVSPSKKKTVFVEVSPSKSRLEQVITEKSNVLTTKVAVEQNKQDTRVSAKIFVNDSGISGVHAGNFGNYVTVSNQGRLSHDVILNGNSLGVLFPGEVKKIPAILLGNNTLKTTRHFSAPRSSYFSL